MRVVFSGSFFVVLLWCCVVGLLFGCVANVLCCL